MSEKLQFQTNVPIDVALKYNDGKEVTGQYGDQVLYTLTDGRVMYVPPIVKKKIDELGIGLQLVARANQGGPSAPGVSKSIYWTAHPATAISKMDQYRLAAGVSARC